jgi:hypothetical protein
VLFFNKYLFCTQAVDRVFDGGFQVVIWSKYIFWSGGYSFFMPSYSMYQRKIVAEHVYRLVVGWPIVGIVNAWSKFWSAASMPYPSAQKLCIKY